MPFGLISGWGRWRGGTTDGRAAALLRGFYVPWVRGLVVGGEYLVVDVGVDVFGVYERAVDVEDASADRGEGLCHRGGDVMQVVFVEYYRPNCMAIHYDNSVWTHVLIY